MIVRYNLYALNLLRLVISRCRCMKRWYIGKWKGKKRDLIPLEGVEEGEDSEHVAHCHYSC